MYLCLPLALIEVERGSAGFPIGTGGRDWGKGGWYHEGTGNYRLRIGDWKVKSEAMHGPQRLLI